MNYLLISTDYSGIVREVYRSIYPERRKKKEKPREAEGIQA
jgi:hypothetical protein